MATAYEDLCKTIADHHKRDDEFEEKCRVLAFAFRKALVDLGFPRENLSWVKWGDRGLETPELHYMDAKRVLQDQGCDAVTLRARAGTFFMWAVLKLRFEDGTFTLLAVEKPFW